MNCGITKQTFLATDENGIDVWYRTKEYQAIREIDHSRIMKHYKDLTAEEMADYETCDWHYHWLHRGKTVGKHFDRSYGEVIIGLCPDWVDKNTGVAAHSVFKSDAALDPWARLQQPPADSEAFRSARMFRNSIYKTLIITGACGHGKTTLAKAVLGDYVRNDESAYFISCEKLADVFVAAQPAKELDLEARDAVADATTADLLVVDDLGTSKEYTDAFKTRFKKLLDEKHGKLILTTNLDRQQMMGKLNEQIVSRIFDTVKVVHLKGRDYRRG